MLCRLWPLNGGRPLGGVVLEADEGEGVFTLDLEMELIDKTRRELPILRNRRPEIYRGDSAARKTES